MRWCQVSKTFPSRPRAWCRAIPLRLAVALLVLVPPLAHAAKVLGVAPQGEVAQVRQVVVRFSEAVVPLGDLRRPAPMSVACSGPVPTGEGRWTSDREWVHDFRAALPPGVRCTVKPVPGWAPLQGTLESAPEVRFATGGPAVLRAEPFEGATIEEDQHFLLRLSGPATADSVAAQAWCEVDGIGERIAVRVVDGADRQAVLAARHVPAADAPRFDSEALWALLQTRRPWAGARALVVRGEGGRDWLADTLRQHGAAVHFVEAYRRTAPVPDAAARALLAAALAAPGEHVWLLSSSEAIGQLALLAPGADWSGARALATHPRIAKTAAGQGFSRVSTVAPDPQAVVAALRAPAPAEVLDAAAPPGPPTAPRGLQSPRP